MRLASTPSGQPHLPRSARREELPQSVTSAAYDSPQRQVAAVAEAAYYLYERQLQRERQPELSIRLPQEVQHQLQQQGGAAAARGKGGSSSSRDTELRVRVEFRGGVAAGAGAGPPAGLHFWQQYAATDAQVRRTSGWLPCVDSPGAAVQWEGLEVTVRADEVGAGRVKQELRGLVQDNDNLLLWNGLLRPAVVWRLPPAHTC